jgi:hypothetical protein
MFISCPLKRLPKFVVGYVLSHESQPAELADERLVRLPQASDKFSESGRRNRHQESFRVRTAIATYDTRLLVEKPMGAYAGHHPTRLVNTNAAAMAPKTTAAAPLIHPPRYRTTIAAAAAVRTIRSIVPMFFCITLSCYF